MFQRQLCKGLYQRNSIRHGCKATKRFFLRMHVQSGDKGEAAEERIAVYLTNEIETKYSHVLYDGEESRGRGSMSSSGETRSSSSSASRQTSPDVRLKYGMSEVGRKPWPNPKTSHTKSIQKWKDGPKIKITPGKRQDMTPKLCTSNMKRADGPRINITPRKLWLVGCFGFNGPLRQYFSLYRAVSQREGERGEKG